MYVIEEVEAETFPLRSMIDSKNFAKLYRISKGDGFRNVIGYATATYENDAKAIPEVFGCVELKIIPMTGWIAANFAPKALVEHALKDFSRVCWKQFIATSGSFKPKEVTSNGVKYYVVEVIAADQPARPAHAEEPLPDTPF